MIGCAAGGATVTGMTWKEWGKTTGGQGTGTLNVDLLSTPVIVVVFNDVNGVFQDVSVSPAQSVTTTTTGGNGGTSGNWSDDDSDNRCAGTARRIATGHWVGWKLTTSSFHDSRQGPRHLGRGGARHTRSPRFRVSRQSAPGGGVIALRRSTVVGMGTGAAVIAALALGFAVGSAIGSPSPAANTGLVGATTGVPPAPLESGVHGYCPDIGFCGTLARRSVVWAGRKTAGATDAPLYRLRPRRRLHLRCLVVIVGADRRIRQRHTQSERLSP